MKYNIPARTLRDWMKRLNIKSVFTHHSQNKDERNSGADSSHEETNEAKVGRFEKDLNRPLLCEMEEFQLIHLRLVYADVLRCHLRAKQD